MRLKAAFIIASLIFSCQSACPQSSIFPQRVNGTLFPTGFAGADIGAKINAAIASCTVSANARCELRIPSGTYVVKTQIAISKNYVHLHGSGYGDTVLINGLAAGTATLAITGAVSNWLIEGFDFSCGGAGTSCATSGNNIALIGTSGSGVVDGIIRNNRIGDTQGAGTNYAGVSMGASSACGIYAHNTNDIYIQQNFIFGNGRGICSDNTTPSITQNNVMHLEYNTQISSNLSDGLIIFGGSQFGFSAIGNHFESNGGWAINGANIVGGIIAGNYAENNTLGFAVCTTTCQHRGLVISGNTVTIANLAPFLQFDAANPMEGDTIGPNSLNYNDASTPVTIPDAIIFAGTASTISGNVAQVYTAGNAITNLVRLTSASSNIFASGNNNSSLSLGTVTNPVNDQLFSILPHQPYLQGGIEAVCQNSSCVATQFDNSTTSGLHVAGGTNGSHISLWNSVYTLGSTQANIQVSDDNAAGVLNLNPNGGDVTIGTGITQDGGGFKHQRVTTGSINGTTYTNVTLTWTTTFADANYDPACEVLDATSAAVGLSVDHIQAVNAATLVVTVHNGSGGALTGSLICTAVHN